jgi:acid phosphatase type 7
MIRFSGAKILIYRCYYHPKLRYNTHVEKHNEKVGMDMKNSMEDLFYKYKVNVAFAGHVHVYERFLPIHKNVTTQDATIYMTLGMGGQVYGMCV